MPLTLYHTVCFCQLLNSLTCVFALFWWINICGVFPPSPHMLSWLVHGPFCFTFTSVDLKASYHFLWSTSFFMKSSYSREAACLLIDVYSLFGPF
jgi:hypothetical protein